MLFLYVLFFLSWVIINTIYRGFNISTFLLLMYLFSSISGVFLTILEPITFNGSSVTLESVCVYLFLFFLFVYPVIYIGNKLDVRHLCISNKLFFQVSYFCIIIGLSSIILSIRDIVNIFSYDSFEVARQLSLEKEDLSFYKYGFWGYLATIGMITPFFALFLSFYRFFVSKKRGFVLYLLLFTSLSGVFMNLSIAGRDGIVRWVMFFVACCVIFKDMIKIDQLPRKMIFFLFLLSVGVIGLFLLISISRFGDGRGLFVSLLSYIGHPLYYFSIIYHGVGDQCYFGWSSIFPIIPGGVSALDVAKTSLAFRTDTFSTFIGSFVLRVGSLRTILMSLVYFFVVLFASMKYRNRLSYYFSFLIFYQILYIGIFYFVYTSLAWQCSFIIIYFMSKYRIPYKK